MRQIERGSERIYSKKRRIKEEHQIVEVSGEGE